MGKGRYPRFGNGYMKNVLSQARPFNHFPRGSSHLSEERVIIAEIRAFTSPDFLEVPERAPYIN